MALSDKFNADKFEPFTIEMDGRKFEIEKSGATYKHLERKLTQCMEKDYKDTPAATEPISESSAG